MKRKVYLEGEIGEKFGKEFTMDVNSFAEAIRCLDCNFSTFRKYMIESENRGIGFVCEVAGSPVKDERELLLEHGEGDLVISAVPSGSKKGVKVIVGVILMVIAYNIDPSGASSAKIASLMKGAQSVLYAVGANLTVTGVAEMMAPDPSVDNDQDESYLFQGTGQTLIEGDPVPLLYGKLRVPGRPISLQVRNERLNFYDPGDMFTQSVADSEHVPEEYPSGPGGVPGPADQEHVEMK